MRFSLAVPADNGQTFTRNRLSALACALMCLQGCDENGNGSAGGQIEVMKNVTPDLALGFTEIFGRFRWGKFAFSWHYRRFDWDDGKRSV
jgi:hypothetical protein